MTEFKIKNYLVHGEIKPDLFVEIRRIASTEHLRRYKLIPIGNDAYFRFGMQLTLDPLKLPKLYAALDYLTGESDNGYDDFKGSFSFTFELKVRKNGRESKYLYRLFHYRSYIEFSLYQAASQNDTRNPQHINQPVDELFSDDDICRTSLNFCNFMIHKIESMQYTPKPFLKFSDSNLLLFGYNNQDYFYTDYDDYEDYQANKWKLQKEIDSIQESYKDSTDKIDLDVDTAIYNLKGKIEDENLKIKTETEVEIEKEIEIATENVAIKMLKENLELKLISQCTGLTIEKVLKLKESNGMVIPPKNS